MLLSALKESLAAARANLIPGILLWMFGVLILMAYYTLPGTQFIFNAISELKSSGGYFYSFFATALFGGFIPTLFSLYLFPQNTRRIFATIIFGILVWGWRGIEVDFLYRLQAAMFGNDINFTVLFKKVIVDQFVYTLFWAAPFTVLLYLWKDCDFNISRVRKMLSIDYLTRALLSMWISTWCVWIPAVAIIYSLPLELQVSLFNIVLCFYVCLITWLMYQRNAEAKN